MRELSRLLSQKQIHFDPIDHRIPCFPHIINILVKHILDEHQKADFSRVVDRWMIRTTLVQKEQYLKAVRGDTLQRVRDVVNTIRMSASRRQRFKEFIISGNKSNMFQDHNGEEIQLPVVELLHDAKTRWDSTYIMVNRFRKLRPVRVHLSNYFSWTHLSA